MYYNSYMDVLSICMYVYTFISCSCSLPPKIIHSFAHSNQPFSQSVSQPTSWHSSIQPLFLCILVLCFFFLSLSLFYSFLHSVIRRKKNDNSSHYYFLCCFQKKTRISCSLHLFDCLFVHLQLLQWHMDVTNIVSNIKKVVSD